MVFYRKYRPQTLDELDITSVRERLISIVGSGDIPHAFLFSGPKGLGKTSAARILAKTISCEQNSKDKKKGVKNSDQFEPCNKCDICLSITNGSNLDILEIDAASNRGIDEIRDLREKIKFAPVSLSKKVYIIDEVHMLTTEAFNALLKTLEEPPSHAIFVLCTTEPWKLPQTILSRVFNVQFEKPTKEEFIRSIKRIINGEKLQLDDDVYDGVYQLSTGSFRDGAKVIEELALAAKSGKITKELMESSYKTRSIESEIDKLLSFLKKRNTKECLMIIESLAKNGVDFKIVNEKIVNFLHFVLLQRAGIGASQEVSQNVKTLDGFKTEEIAILIEYFSASYKDIKFSVIAQLPLEMAIIKWCELSQDQNEKINDQRTEDASEKKEDSSNGNKKVTQIQSEKEDKKTMQTSNINQSDQDLLKRLIEKVKVDSQTIAGILRSCRIDHQKDGTIVIITPSKFHNDKLSDAKIGLLIGKKLSELLDKKVEPEVQLRK